MVTDDQVKNMVDEFIERIETGTASKLIRIGAAAFAIHLLQCYIEVKKLDK